MAPMARKKETWCPTRLVLGTIEGKWTAHILTELMIGTKRHTEIAKSLPGINPKTLTDRLRELESSGVVRRKMYEEIPPRVEYSITPRGRELSSLFETMSALGVSWQRSMPIDVSGLDPCRHCFPEDGGQGGSGRPSKSKTKPKTAPVRSKR